MKRVWDYFRVVVISPETLVGLTVLAASVFKPGFVIFAAQFIRSNDASIMIALVGVPVALVVAAYKLGESILATAAEKGLVNWSQYWRVKNRVYFAWILCGIDLPVTYLSWYITHQNQLLLGTTTILAAWAMCCVSIASLAHGRISLRDIIAGEGRND